MSLQSLLYNILNIKVRSVNCDGKITLKNEQDTITFSHVVNSVLHPRPNEYTIYVNHIGYIPVEVFSVKSTSISTTAVGIGGADVTIAGKNVVIDAVKIIKMNGPVVSTDKNFYAGRSNTGSTGTITLNDSNFSLLTDTSVIMLTPIGICDEPLSYTSTNGSFTVSGPHNQDFVYNIVKLSN